MRRTTPEVMHALRLARRIVCRPSIVRMRPRSLARRSLRSLRHLCEECDADLLCFSLDRRRARLDTAHEERRASWTNGAYSTFIADKAAHAARFDRVVSERHSVLYQLASGWLSRKAKTSRAA